MLAYASELQRKDIKLEMAGEQLMATSPVNSTYFVATSLCKSFAAQITRERLRKEVDVEKVLFLSISREY